MEPGLRRILNGTLAFGVVGVVNCILGLTWLDSDIPLAVAGVCAGVMLLLLMYLKSRLMLP